MDPDAWKRAAFQHIVANRRNQKKYDPQDGTNLIAIGDSAAEMTAAHHAAEVVGGPNTLVKTVKFKEHPSVTQLIGQLQRTAHDLEHLVTCTENTSIILEECQLNSSGWKFCDCRSWSSSFKVPSKPPVFGPRREDALLPHLLGRISFVHPEQGRKSVDHFCLSSQSKTSRAWWCAVEEYCWKLCNEEPYSGRFFVGGRSRQTENIVIEYIPGPYS